MIKLHSFLPVFCETARRKYVFQITMSIKEADLVEVYKNDPKLKPEDVKSLWDWADKQPHLPKMTEMQVVLFLQSCYYSNEMAKTTIDNYFTAKTLCPEIFGNRNPDDPQVETAMNVMMVALLPKQTPDGYSVIYIKLMNSNPDIYNFPLQIRCFDMYTLLALHQVGPKEGMIMLVDMKGIVFGHFLKLSVVIMKKFLYYLQEAMPIRLKSLEFYNIVPFMDKILAIMKPFMKKELIDALYLHTTMESLYSRVPQDLLPQEYGGSTESLEILHEKFKALLNDNKEFLKFQDSQIVDESRRPGKPKNVGDVFGMEGTFKKLEVD
ncbi:alpha-tocopherol transfer protein-like [Anoplophora glabripennis]|uniref:alpha-tocopherol transfer protein-like n=1 Tax=Anoplophora glabripennis TaxID=217634 RepID=UPI0008757224|nr:alpha-tocopherol transfer protein-like [Anoplophora glabripennis]